MPDPGPPVPTVPDTQKRLRTYGASDVLTAIGFFFIFLNAVLPDLMNLYPSAKWVILLGVAGKGWSALQRKQDAAQVTSVNMSDREILDVRETKPANPGETFPT